MLTTRLTTATQFGTDSKEPQRNLLLKRGQPAALRNEFEIGEEVETPRSDDWENELRYIVSRYQEFLAALRE